MAQLPRPWKMCNNSRNKNKYGDNKNKSGDNFDGKKAVYNIGFGDSFYIPDFVKSKKEQNKIFANLVNEIEFEQMFNFKGNNSMLQPIPRLVIAQTFKENCIETPIYRMPGCNERNIGTVEWTPTVAAIRDAASQMMKQEFNHCVATMYRDGSDSLGFHKDKLIDLKDDSVILSISFGAPRIIEFRKVDTNKTRNDNHGHSKQSIMLQPGSLLAIGDKTNKNFEHSIVKMNNLNKNGKPVAIGPRISLSMRSIDTFRNSKSNEIVGKGKEWQTKNYPFITSHDDVETYSKDVLDQFCFWKEQTKEYLTSLRKYVNDEQQVNDEQVNDEQVSDQDTVMNDE